MGDSTHPIDTKDGQHARRAEGRAGDIVEA
jgi:hypothetical protein